MLSDILNDLHGAAALDAGAALKVRRAIYAGDATISTDEAEALVALNDGAADASAEWRALFVEALTDYLVRQRAPQGYVDQAGADWIVAAVSRDGVVKGDTELELLIHVLEAADSAPSGLSAFALRQCVAAVRAPDANGAARVDDAEAARLRRVLYAGGGANGVGVSREEAEALFDINDACRGGDDAAAWRDLFVHAVANHLLFASTYRPPEAAEVMRRQAWLEAPTHLDWWGVLKDPASALRLAFEPDEEGGWTRVMAADDVAQADAHRLTDDERSWLNARIGRDGAMDANEKALLDFVLADAAQPPPSTPPCSAAGRARPPELSRAPRGRYLAARWRGFRDPARPGGG